MEKIANCPVCLSKNIRESADYASDSIFYSCPVCGRFELTSSVELDLNVLASYLFYNRFDIGTGSEMRYHTTLSKERCDRYQQEFNKGNISQGRPVHMDDSIIFSWYPKSFSERIDMILLNINRRASHIGQVVNYSNEELISLLFVDRYEKQNNGQCHIRKNEDYIAETQYMLDYLLKQQYIEGSSGVNDSFKIMLMPKGLSQVDLLERNLGTGRDVMIAMKFGDDTLKLREAIKKGIQDAGFKPILIDEVEHNDFITPEILKHIKNSKFVVVDLTHHNNGAYFEEGYAMGLGKPVIQLCKASEKLHFDVAQKNTIMWEKEEDIPLRLKNRILATID